MKTWDHTPEWVGNGPINMCTNIWTVSNVKRGKTLIIKNGGSMFKVNLLPPTQ